jgi:nicotinamide-nucleotide amidase
MMIATGPKAEIIAVGTELLTPHFRDTNSLFLIEKLEDRGIRVAFRTIVGDDREDLIGCLRTALRRSQLIVVTGGLGPTEDDRTREVAAEALGRGLVFDAAVRKAIRDRFRGRGLGRMPASNRKQCFVIEGAKVLANPNGTAPGLWIETGSRRLVLLPGPPRELEPMFDAAVVPRLAGFGSGFTVRRVLKVTGLPESRMEDRLKSIYPKIPAGVGVTTLACPGDLQVRLTVSGMADRGLAERMADRSSALVCRKLGDFVYSSAGETLEEVVGGLLRSRGRTVACAESCTGGLLSYRLTDVPGSSVYFLEGIVAYSNRAKSRRLGVPSALIRANGAVSASVVEAMARAVRERAGSDYGLAVTGIAGPSGGSEEKPVGLVFTALAWNGGAFVERNLFRGTRETVKSQSAQKALDMLRRRLLFELRERP